MAESWVRLWAGSTTDPKWQTIARKSGQPRYLVIALFTHLLMVANDAEVRGDIRDLSIEDTASALDCDEEQVEAIIQAMEGRVIDDWRLTGWDKRQVFREDYGNEHTGAKSAAERKREQRERDKLAAEQAQTNGEVTACHDESREVTACHAPEADTESDADTDTETPRASIVTNSTSGTPAGLVCARLKAECRITQGLNPQNPKLLALLDAGLTADEIIAAGMDAKVKTFAYVLAAAEGRRRDADAVAALPNTRSPPNGSRRQTLTEKRAETIANLTGANRNERQSNTERDITAETLRLA